MLAMASGESRVTLSQPEILDILRRECKAAGSQRTWARDHGVSETSVSLALCGVEEIRECVVNALGYVKRPMFFKIVKDREAT